jgi:hypothetical protein
MSINSKKRRDARKRRKVSNRIQAKAVPKDLTLSIEAGAESGFELIEATEGDANTSKRFRMRAYTGGRLMLGNFGHPVVVDLAGIKTTGSSRPILRDHDMSRIVGHTTAIEVKGNAKPSLDLVGLISASNDHAREVQESAANGFPWQASIGARAERMVFVDKGESVQVNGRNFTGPVYVARKSTLGEVSFVAIGADEGGATATVEATTRKGNAMKEFETWLQAKGFSLEDMDETQTATMQAMFDAEQADPEDTIQASDADDDVVDVVALGRKAAADDVKRIAAIGKLACKHPAIHAQAIEDNWNTSQTELAVLKADRPKAEDVRAGSTNDDLNSDAIEAALLCSVGMAQDVVATSYNEKAMNLATSKEYRAFTLHALMGSAIRASGGNYSGSAKSNDFIRAAFVADRELKAAGGFSTLSVTNVLENVANKTLIAAYESIETTWRSICAVRNYSDFKTQSRYRLDSNGAFKEVASDGELKHLELSDAKYTNSLATYGAMIALTRQDIINDDLDAFLQIPRMLGRLSAQRIEEAVYVLLLSNPSSFFAAGNGNLQTGAGSALSITSLTDVKADFRNFVSDGKPILSSPRTLIVGTTLEQTARNLVNEAMIIATDMSATTDSTAPARNPHAGTLPGGLQVSPYLNNTSILDEAGAAITGQSATQWYLFGDPNVRAAVQIGFLNGQQVPTIESADTDFSSLGMQWRGYHDFGVAMEETVGAVKSDGA